MPASASTRYTTSELSARVLARYTPLLPPSLRLPAYRQPNVQWVVTPHCDPAFAQLMRSTWARLDLTDRAQFSPEEARLLQAHRFYGSVALFHKGRTAAEHHWSREQANIHFVGFQAALTSLLGEALLKLLGPRLVPTLFPWHDCTMGSDKSGRCWRLHCDSLLTHTTTDGRTVYFAAHRPQLTIRGHRRTLAFTAHAIHRYEDRMSYGPTLYTSLGDTFGFVNDPHHYVPARLHPFQDAVCIWYACMPGFLTDQYPTAILAQRQPDTPYQYLLGYCPLTAAGDFWIATTLLPPGYTGTPEYGVLQGAALPRGEKARMLGQCVDFSYHRICDTMDFSLLQWFHQHGIPQVRPTEKGEHQD